MKIYYSKRNEARNSRVRTANDGSRPVKDMEKSPSVNGSRWAVDLRPEPVQVIA